MICGRFINGIKHGKSKFTYICKGKLKACINWYCCCYYQCESCGVIPELEVSDEEKAVLYSEFMEDDSEF